MKKTLLKSKLSFNERAELTKALLHIGDKKKNGDFTVRALELQKKHGSTIAIQKKLRRFTNISVKP